MRVCVSSPPACGLCLVPTTLPRGDDWRQTYLVLIQLAQEDWGSRGLQALSSPDRPADLSDNLQKGHKAGNRYNSSGDRSMAGVCGIKTVVRQIRATRRQSRAEIAISINVDEVVFPKGLFTSLRTLLSATE